MDGLVEDLVAMGFEESRAREAVEKSGGGSISDAIDWIDQNRLPDAAAAPLDQAALNESTIPATESTASSSVYIRCDICGKLFKNQHEASFHAYKTDHESFSEALGPVVKPCSPEELNARKEDLQRRIKKFKELRKKRDVEEEIEREKKRRAEGKYRGNIRAEMRDIRMKKEVEERKRDKEEERVIRAKLLKQIEADRQTRNSTKHDAETVTGTTIKPTKCSLPPTDSCKIQVRWPDGRCFNRTFSPSDTLSDVHTWIQSELQSYENFSFQSTFPRRRYEEEDKSKSLQNLGLCPSACFAKFGQVRFSAATTTTTMRLTLTTSFSGNVVERNFDSKLTLLGLKERLVLVTGASVENMELVLKDVRNDFEEIINVFKGDEQHDKTLDQLGFRSGHSVHVIDDTLQFGVYDEMHCPPVLKLNNDDKARPSALREFIKARRAEAKKKAMFNQTHIGTRCVVQKDGSACNGHTATIRYVGKSHDDFVVGIEYDEPIGNNDGSLDGTVYFSCPPNYGSLVRPETIRIINNNERCEDEDNVI
ncbi:hypothetical protein ACOME3_005821 [Neoechinorhynchus agilis]